MIQFVIYLLVVCHGLSAAPSPLSNLQGSEVRSELVLKSSVEGNTTLYPGQRTTLKYEYYYTGLIDLTIEHLPLLDPSHLIKIGEKEIKNATIDGVSIMVVSQVVQADKPGVYKLGPSLVEGYAYTLDDKEKHILHPPKISSTSEAITLTILSFPVEDKPHSFNGAIGDHLQFQAKLLGGTDVRLNDLLTIEISIKGPTLSREVPIPELCFQPGFSGFFKIEDLNSALSLESNVERAKINLRPLITEIKEIPSIEFSYFSPTHAKYVVVQTPPIVFKILPTISHPLKDISNTAFSQSSISDESLPSLSDDAILSLKDASLYHLRFGTWWCLFLIPFGLLIFYYQRQNKTLTEMNLKNTLVNPVTLLNQSLAYPLGTGIYFNGIIEALKTLLFQKGIIINVSVDIETIPSVGLSGEIKKFLVELNEQRFTRNKTIDYQSIESQAKNLLHANKETNSLKFLSKSKGKIFFCYLIYSLFIILMITPHFNEDARLKEAVYQHQKGKIALTIAEKKTAFNIALKNYLILENSYTPIFGNGKLYANIADLYTQLEDYANAIYYYSEAKKLDPRSIYIQQALDRLNSHLNTAPIKPIFNFFSFLSLPEILQLFSLVTVLATALLSIFVFYPKAWIKRSLIIVSCLIACFLTSFIYTYYISPIKGILMQPIILRREAGLDYAKVEPVPVSAGTEVEIIDIVKDGTWVKIVTPQGSLGYAPKNIIRILR